MVTSRGKAQALAVFADAPKKLASVLRGAGRAGATVIADEARERASFGETRDAIAVTTRATASGVTAKVTVKKGYGRSVGFWLEYGTSPHFISVDPAQRAGTSAGRVNRLDKRAAAEGRSGPGKTLVINGKLVGATVLHPGARKQPFLRPALDIKKVEATAAAQSYINARVKPSGIVVDAESEGDEA